MLISLLLTAVSIVKDFLQALPAPGKCQVEVAGSGEQEADESILSVHLREKKKGQPFSHNRIISSLPFAEPGIYHLSELSFMVGSFERNSYKYLKISGFPSHS